MLPPFVMVVVVLPLLSLKRYDYVLRFSHNLFHKIHKYINGFMYNRHNLKFYFQFIVFQVLKR